MHHALLGSYAQGGTAYANVPSGGGRRSNRAAVAGGMAEVCATQASGLADWPIEHIAQVVQPDDAQRAALDELKGAAMKAVGILQSACPTALPSTPTGRLAAMRQRLQPMLAAVRVLRPALDKFYGSLSDEQKARFDAIEPDSKRTARPQPDLAQLCSGRATAGPIDRIERALHPTDAQRAALDNLKQASSQAADLLKTSCSAEQSLTATGRLEAMETRLEAMLKAVNTVQPALGAFYNSLSDEQKAAFNQLSPRQG